MEDIKHYIEAKENQFLERKSAKYKPMDILKHLVGFANSDGGTLVIGVEDDGKVTGFKSRKCYDIEEYRNIPLVKLRKTPIKAKYEEIKVKNYLGEDDKILVIRVEPAIDRVIYSYDEEVYLRQYDRTEKLNHEQVKELEYDRGERYFEDEIVEDSSLEDIDLNLIEDYKKHLNLSKDLTVDDILNARNLIKNNHLTKAGVLLFAKNPTKYLPQARLKFVRYDGFRAKLGEEINIVKEVTFDEAIPKVILKAKEFILTQLREFQYLDREDGAFKKMPEYPEFAWFEGIVNALTHRNYFIRGDYIKFIMFDDRIEISSPGVLPNIVTIENIKNQRYSRNPRIARVLSEFGWVKEMNEGVKRIYSEMENFFLNSPEYSEPNYNVLLVLENNILNRRLRVSENLEKLLTTEIYNNLRNVEKEVIHFAYINKKITVSFISKRINKGNVTSAKILKKLVDNGILEWHGTNSKDPRQYYCLIEK